MRPLSPGKREEFGFQVEARHLASALDGGEGGLFPDVFSTAFLVGLMEAACSRLLARHLEPGEMSVGAGLERVTHVAPTPAGARVRAVAVYTGSEGRLLRFEIQAFDDDGLIGEAVHRRAVVDAARFHARARTRKATTSGP